MNTLLVVGSNSFSGSTFVSHALAQGSRVLGISRSPEPADVFLAYKGQECANFSFHQLDLNHDLSEIGALLQDARPDFVVNFAAQSMVGESWQAPGDWFMTNTVSTVRLHDLLRKCAFLKRYVHVSTPEVYGSCSGLVTEDAPFNPSTPYAVSRAAADMSLRTFFNTYDFPIVTTRAANVYGPGQQLYRIIPRTILFILLGRRLQLHGGGMSMRSFVHMQDVSDATWRIMLHGRNGETYHISTREIISIRALVERICDRLGVLFKDHVEIVGERIGKDAAYHLDSTKLREELGWQDRINLDQGIDESIEWVTRKLDVLKNQPFDYQHKV